MVMKEMTDGRIGPFRNTQKECECDNPHILYGSTDVYCVKCGCNNPIPKELKDILKTKTQQND